MKDLLTAITTTLRTVTPKVYFLHLPDDSVLKDITITYSLTNSFNDSQIENPEALKTWDLIVNINSPKITKGTNSNNESERILQLYDPVKESIYSLPVGWIKVINEDFFFDPNLEIYTQMIRFEVKN